MVHIQNLCYHENQCLNQFTVKQSTVKEIDDINFQL